MVDLHWIWKGILIVVIGSLLLRIAGRKSISQLTVTQTVIMISVGSLIIQPVSDRNIWITFLITAVIILTLLVLEYLEVKFDIIEKIFTGNAVVVIENGQINEKNLKRLRLTVDKLEVRLRQLNIDQISKVQWATLEPNGQLGYKLMPNEEPATKKDIQDLRQLIEEKMPQPPVSPPVQHQEDDNLFNEIKNKTHVEEKPKHLE